VLTVVDSFLKGSKDSTELAGVLMLNSGQAIEYEFRYRIYGDNGVFEKNIVLFEVDTVITVSSGVDQSISLIMKRVGGFPAGNLDAIVGLGKVGSLIFTLTPDI
jgi:hypothetical protein